ncbi:MAG: hypothetical protein JNJ58_12745, partial [Chitinophagaceae bacterium]|nr:hypothetical protein [Chitinophagaceae bacterium]
KEKKNAGQYAHDKYAFRKFAFEMAQANPHLLPPAEPLQEWESDITLFDTLRLISQDLKVLNEAISDTLFALGIESHKHAIHFLFMARLAARSNIAGMDSVVERLETALHGKS